jgi:hypothetical protein
MARIHGSPIRNTGPINIPTLSEEDAKVDRSSGCPITVFGIDGPLEGRPSAINIPTLSEDDTNIYCHLRVESTDWGGPLYATAGREERSG